jgi:hypothetical protein
MLLSVFSSVLHLPRLERRFGLVLLATLGTAMLPLTWEDEKAVWIVMAALIGMSVTHVARPGEATRRLVPSGGPWVPVAPSPMKPVTALRQRLGGDVTA